MRVIPKKNYFILGIVILVTLLLVYYFYLWYDAYKETKLNMRIIDSYLEVINYNELDDYLVENQDTVIYVSVLENSEIREFEKKFKRSLKNNEISRDILYMDITKELDDKHVSQELKSRYGISGDNVPLIMVFKSGELDSVYNIKNDKNDIDSLKKYLVQNGLNGDSELDG